MSTAALSSPISLGPWYGFYDPLTPLPTPSREALQGLAETLDTPIQGLRQAEQFVSMAAQVLPTFRSVSDRVREGEISLRLWDEPIPAYSNQAGPSEILYLPRHWAPRAYLPAFFVSAGNAARPPSGAEAPPEPLTGDANQIRTALLQRHSWLMALSETFLFQMTLELSHVGLLPEPTSIDNGLLGGTDLALFRILREKGLPGLAGAYPRFMRPMQKEHFDHGANLRVEQILAGGLQMTDEDRWRPSSALGERPILPVTIIDRSAQEGLRFEHGLYQRAKGLKALPQKRRDQIHKTLGGKVFGDGDLLELRRLIEEIAPALAPSILAIWKTGGLRVRVVQEIEGAPPTEAAVLILSDRHFMGLPTPEIPEILVRRGERMNKLLPPLVRYLARASVPAELLRPMEVVRFPQRGQAVMAIARLMERRFIRQDVWGHTAVLELQHEARQTGISLSGPMPSPMMAEIIRDSGFEVLCDRWYEFLDPDLLSFMRAQFQQKAAAMVDSSFVRTSPLH